MYPRDFAIGIDLPADAGIITCMFPCKDFLEIYTPIKTFHFQTPNGVDPERKNPLAPWVRTLKAETGSKNSIIARLILQGDEFLRLAVFKKNIDQDSIRERFYEVKEVLLACEKIFLQLKKQEGLMLRDLQMNGLSIPMSNRVVTSLPKIPGLAETCKAFLIHANDAVRLVSGLPNEFMELERVHSNFDHLAMELTKTLGNNSKFTQLVAANARGVEMVVDLRNGLEHQKTTKGKKTFIKNFQLMPDCSVRRPEWSLEGEPAYSIIQAMPEIIEFLVDMAEGILIALFMEPSLTHFPYRLEKIAESEVRFDAPARYRLHLDMRSIFS